MKVRLRSCYEYSSCKTDRGAETGHEVTVMDESDFEGTLVLEKLVQISKLDAFIEAVDSDDFDMAKSLMKRARVDSETIAAVLKMMKQANGEH